MFKAMCTLWESPDIFQLKPIVLFILVEHTYATKYVQGCMNYVDGDGLFTPLDCLSVCLTVDNKTQKVIAAT